MYILYIKRTLNRAILASGVIMVIAAVLLGAVAVFSSTQPAYAGDPGFFILDDSTGGACEPSEGAIGKWNDKTKTCRLTVDLGGPIIIGDDDITLNCNGHLLDGPGSGDGISLVGRSGVTIRNCNVTDYTVGIKLLNSDDNTLQGNNAFLNDEDGIRLISSDNNTLQGNTAKDNEERGIRLLSSDDNKLSENTANENVQTGIFLDFSDNNTLNDNTANGNDDGAGDGIGILLDDSDDNTLKGNTANDNASDGISLLASNNNTLNGNTANGNFVGIVLSSSNMNTLNGNTANDSKFDTGILLGNSDNNTLIENTTNDNFVGILLSSSNMNTLNGNTANGNIIGIFLFGSDMNTLNGNTAFKNLDSGFLLSSTSDDNTLEDNESKNNDEFGFEDPDDTANTYTDNKCVANGSGGSLPTGLCSPQE